MPASTRKLSHTDILPTAQYSAERLDRRREMLPVKKRRRVAVGPIATFLFESYGTMWLQVHEMLYIEKGGAAQIEDELNAYNPLIPQGQELVATMLLEVEDAGERVAALRQLTGIERFIALDVGGERIKAVAEDDAERTREDGKTSSVHFMRFPFTPAQIARFKDPAADVFLVIEHETYRHRQWLQPETRAELAKDFT